MQREYSRKHLNIHSNPELIDQDEINKIAFYISNDGWQKVMKLGLMII